MIAPPRRKSRAGRPGFRAGRRFCVGLRLSPLLCALALTWCATPAHSQTLALPGYSGLLNVPSADVLRLPSLEFAFSNHYPVEIAGNPLFKPGQNYLVGVGMLPGIELTGRLSEYPRRVPREPPLNVGVRDLSGSFKWQLPLERWLGRDTRIALGSADYSGGARFFRADYVVGSQRLGPVDVTLGFGAGPQRMDGLIGGVSIQLPAGFLVLVDHDAAVTSAGLRWASPVLTRLNDARVVATLSQRGSARGASARTEFQLALQVPLSSRMQAPTARVSRIARGESTELKSEWDEAPATVSTEVSAAPARMAVTALAPVAAAEPALVTPEAPVAQRFTPGPLAARALPAAATRQQRAAQVTAALARRGFSCVRVGHSGEQLVVELHNQRYNRSVLDALGVAIGEASRLADRDDRELVLTLLNNRVPVVTVVTQPEAWRQYLQFADVPPPPRLFARFGEPGRARNVQWVSGGAADGLFGPPCEGGLWGGFAITPYQRTFVGNEVATASLAAGLNLQPVVHFGRGLAATADVFLPLYASAQFEEGGGFERFRPRGGLQTALMNWTVAPSRQVINQLSVGRVRAGPVGVANETMSQLDLPGNPWARLRIGAFRDDKLDRDYFYAVAGVQQQPRLLPGAVVELSYGQWWQGDRGVSLEVTRWFGDVSVQLFARRTGVTVAGLNLSVPLVPRRELTPGRLFVRGAEQFQVGQGTTVASQGEANPVLVDVAVLPRFTYGLQRTMFDYGRLSGEAIAHGTERMRDAWLRLAAEP